MIPSVSPTAVSPAAPYPERSGTGASRGANLTVALAIGVLLLAGVVMTPDVSRGGVVLTLFGYPLPTVCWFKLTTGMPCAGCGLTRSVVLLLHGRPAASWTMHPFGIAVVALALLALPPRLGRAAGREERWFLPWDRAWLVAAVIAGAGLLVWWLVRICYLLGSAPPA